MSKSYNAGVATRNAVLGVASRITRSTSFVGRSIADYVRGVRQGEVKQLTVQQPR